MMAKAVKGRGFRGALEYDLGKEQGRVIDTNMNGNSPRELAAEFGEIRKLRPVLGKAVLHVSLSAAPGEHLTNTQWIEIGRRYLLGMGLDRNQYIVTRHTDTDHEHVHLLANRIQFDGAVTSDSHDYRRQEVLMRAIERDLGLRQVGLSENCERRAATKGEIEEGMRTGRASTRQQLQQLCDAAMVGCPGFVAYAARLIAAGVELVPVTQLEGTKLSGLSYRLDGVTMKGSDLGKRYSPAGLAKHGVSYDKERDFETVSRCLEPKRLDSLGQQLQALHAARIESVEHLASMLEPLAQAMAALTEESRQALTGIEQQCREQADRLKNQVDVATAALTQASRLAQQAANDMDSAARRTEWRHYLLTVSTGLMSGLLVSAFWLWLAPSAIDATSTEKAAPVLLSPGTPTRQSNGRSPS